jgi:hypothetical protein
LHFPTSLLFEGASGSTNFMQLSYEYNILENFLPPITFLKHSDHSNLWHYSDINVTQRIIFRKLRGLSVLILITA